MAGVTDTGEVAPHVVRINGTPMTVVDSFVYRWVFDTEARRFRRVPRTMRLDVVESHTGWLSYEELRFDDATSSFTVVLNASGTKVLQATWEAEPEASTA